MCYMSHPFDRSTARFQPPHRFSLSFSSREGENSRLPLVLTSANVSGLLMSQPNSLIAEPARIADPRAVDLRKISNQSATPLLSCRSNVTHSRISGRITLKPPMSARTAIARSPLVMPPSTLRCLRSVFESSFMLSMIARVWNALASSVARAMCAGVVYCDMPGEM